MSEWPIVEIGPQAEHHRQGQVRVVERRHEVVDEAFASRLVGDGVQLFELVDHQQERHVFVVGQVSDRLHDGEVSTGHPLQEESRAATGAVEQGFFHRFEGACPRPHHGDVTPAVANRGHDAGAQDARLAAPARADQRDQLVRVDALEDLGHKLGSAEEPVGVCLGERPQSLVGIRRDRRDLLLFGEHDEVGVLEQDASFESLQLATGLDAEFLSKDRTQSLVRAQCFRLSPGAVQGKHVVSPQSLSQWILGDEGFQLGDQLLGATVGEVGGDPQLSGGDP